MKRLFQTLVLLLAVTVLPLRANPPQLRLSWNPSLKADLQIADEVIKPSQIKVINEQGAVLLTHRFSEFSEGRVSFDRLGEGTYQLVLVSSDGSQVRAERFRFVKPGAGEVTSVTLKILPTGTFGDRTANPANTTGNVISPFTPEQ